MVEVLTKGLSVRFVSLFINVCNRQHYPCFQIKHSNEVGQLQPCHSCTGSVKYFWEYHDQQSWYEGPVDSDLRIYINLLPFYSCLPSLATYGNLLCPKFKCSLLSSFTITHSFPVCFVTSNSRLCPKLKQHWRKHFGTLRILTEKFHTHQQGIFHNFVDFKNAFDCVWRILSGTEWKNLKSEKRSKCCLRLCVKMLVNNDYRNWSKATVGPPQGCVLSPSLLNFFPARMVDDAVDSCTKGAQCRGLAIKIIRASSEHGLRELTNWMNITASSICIEPDQWMEISVRKGKL